VFLSEIIDGIRGFGTPLPEAATLPFITSVLIYPSFKFIFSDRLQSRKASAGLLRSPSNIVDGMRAHSSL